MSNYEMNQNIKLNYNYNIQSDTKETMEDNQTHTDIKFDNEKITLYQGDCISMLENIPNKSIQLICIDPPYNIGILGKLNFSLQYVNFGINLIL